MRWQSIVVALLVLVLSAPLDARLARQVAAGEGAAGWVARAAAQPVGIVGCPSPAHDNEADHSAAYFVGATSWAAQSFRVAQAMGLGRVSLQIANQRPSLDDTFTVEIRTGGAPPGSQLLASSTIVDPEVVYHWAGFAFDPAPQLSPGTDYYIVAMGSGSSLNGYGWGVDATAPAYTDGQTWTSAGRGSSWAARPDVDTMFRVWSTTCRPPVKVAIIDDAAEAAFAEYVGADFSIVAPDGLGDAMMQLQRFVEQGYRIHTLVFYGHAGTQANTAVSPPRPVGAMEIGGRDYAADSFERLVTDFPSLAQYFVDGAQVQLLNCTLGQDTALVEAVARAFLRNRGGTVWAKDGDVGSFGTPTFWGLLNRRFFNVDLPESPDLYFWTRFFSDSDGEWRAWYLSSEVTGNSFTSL